MSVTSNGEAVTDLTPPFDPQRDHWRGGDPGAATLLVFGDYQCPYTRMADRSIRRLRDEYGALRVSFRHLPLTDIHPRALAAAVVAEAAAAQGRFWEMHDLLFDNQKALAADDLHGYAAELAVDLDAADTDSITTRLEADYRSAIESGVRGTPTLFINGELYVESYQSDDLGRALEAAGLTR